MKNCILIILSVFYLLTAQTLTMDSVTVDSVWNSDSAGIVQRDCKISFCPKGNMKRVRYVPSISFDGGISWSQDSIQCLDKGNDTVMVLCGSKRTLLARVKGGDRLQVCVRVIIQMPLPDMVSITGGTFKSGENSGSVPIFTVTVSSFRMGKTEVTQELYAAVMGKNPSYFKGDLLRPVEVITWYDAAKFCNDLSKLSGLDTVYIYTGVMDKNVQIDYTKNGYRLPTFAEREYAARAGTTTAYYWGRNTLKTSEDTASVDSYAVWAHNSYKLGASSPEYGTHRVASKKPNTWGLYDMSGNVFEWTNTWDKYPTDNNQVDPITSSGSYKLTCGGCWGSRGNDWYLRSVGASLNLPTEGFSDFGLRLVCRL